MTPETKNIYDHAWFAARVREDHVKLDRIFTGLESTLQTMAEQGTQDSDLLQDARDDLSFALDEMLEHFGIEEEAIFVPIREALPSMGKAIDALELGHEMMCKRTSTLRKMVAAARASASPLDIPEALAIVGETTRLLAQHNRQEVELFYRAFESLDPPKRARLIDAIKGH